MTDVLRTELRRGANLYHWIINTLNYLNYEKDYRVFHRRGDVEH